MDAAPWYLDDHRGDSPVGRRGRRVVVACVAPGRLRVVCGSSPFIAAVFEDSSPFGVSGGDLVPAGTLWLWREEGVGLGVRRPGSRRGVGGWDG